MALKLKFYYLMIIRLDNKIFISSPFKNVINTKITKENLIFFANTIINSNFFAKIGKV